jgi:dethiobiotin synthetase
MTAVRTPAVFITGTDTGAGKTRISCALLLAAQRRSLRAVGMKPVASGSTWQAGALRNEDADLIHAHSSPPVPARALINPYTFEEPIAPQLAARHAGVEIELGRMQTCFQALADEASLVIVEGVGGWAVPFSDTMMQMHLVRALDVPVIMVVGIRLGCINHALLSARAIAADGCRLLGWIANRIDPETACSDEVIASIAGQLGVPLLAEVPHGLSVDRMAAIVDPALDPVLAGAVAGSS